MLRSRINALRHPDACLRNTANAVCQLSSVFRPEAEGLRQCANGLRCFAMVVRNPVKVSRYLAGKLRIYADGLRHSAIVMRGVAEVPRHPADVPRLRQPSADKGFRKSEFIRSFDVRACPETS